MSDIFEKLTQLVIDGNDSMLETMIQMALDTGTSASDILDKGLLPAMDLVGQRMNTGDIFIPEVLVSATTMQGGVELITPFLGAGDRRNAGTCVIGTVEGDLHDIGKNIVGMMLSGSGFKVIDLGVDVKSADFVKAIEEHNATIVGMSTLLTTTMLKMEETIKCITKAGMRDSVKVLIGGAPVTQKFADDIGADGYGFDAHNAVKRAKEVSQVAVAG